MDEADVDEAGVSGAAGAGNAMAGGRWEAGGMTDDEVVIFDDRRRGTSNTQHPTPNTQHPTSPSTRFTRSGPLRGNIQWRTGRSPLRAEVCSVRTAGRRLRGEDAFG